MTAVTLDTDLLLGRVIGNYRLVAKIGAGGMGAVYRAEHILLGKPAAVKVLLPERCSNPEIVDRFFNEAKAAALIRNPGIVDIFDYGRLDDGNAYIVMEMLDGESLGDRLRRESTLSPHAAASIARHIAGALGAAHRHGIVHRDLKPDNVFLVPDATLPRGERAKLLDFGIAKLQTTASDLVKTDTGRLMGTPYYMSPEQCRGAGRVDHRTDIYSLGCVLYQMLAGRPPFVLEGAGEILAAHIYEQPAPPSTYVDVPPSLEAVVMKLLSKDSTKRYQSMDDVVTALNEAVVKFAGEEAVEPSLEESEKFRTNRTPKVGNTGGFKDDATTVTATAAYLDVQVERRPRWPLWIAVLALTAAIAGALAVALFDRADAPQSTTSPSPSASPNPNPNPGTTPPVAPTIESLGQRDVRAADGTAGTAPMPSASAYVSIVVTSEPDGASVFRELDGVRLGKTPLTVQMLRGPGEAALVVKRSGYRSERLSLPLTEDQSRHLVLREKKGEPEPPAQVPPAVPPPADDGPIPPDDEP